ncbi:MAG: DNA repair ATPase, partial [Phycisphaerae bacterium]|nr:DNA repair ATPase [Phycisphaerae bacterium]
MADNDIKKDVSVDGGEVRLEGGTYEVIRNRLQTHSTGLQDQLGKLNVARKDVFGAVENKLVSSERISTENNCVPRDMVPLDHHFIFGYNVFVGLRTETVLSDVFAVYKWQDGVFVQDTLSLIEDERFLADFQNLYKYYRLSTFVKFAVIGHHLFMVFRVGKTVADIKTFKWLIRGEKLE